MTLLKISILENRKNEYRTINEILECYNIILLCPKVMRSGYPATEEQLYLMKTFSTM